MATLPIAVPVTQRVVTEQDGLWHTDADQGHKSFPSKEDAEQYERGFDIKELASDEVQLIDLAGSHVVAMASFGVVSEIVNGRRVGLKTMFELHLTADGSVRFIANYNEMKERCPTINASTVARMLIDAAHRKYRDFFQVGRGRIHHISRKTIVNKIALEKLSPAFLKDSSPAQQYSRFLETPNGGSTRKFLEQERLVAKIDTFSIKEVKDGEDRAIDVEFDCEPAVAAGAGSSAAAASAPAQSGGKR